MTITKKEAEKKALELAGLKQPEEIFKEQGQVKFYLQEQPIYYDTSDLWWVWKKEEKKWALSNEVDILNKIEELTGEDIISPKRRTLILNSLKQECRKSKPIDIKPTWIQFRGKIFDIKTGEIIDASPTYFSTNPIPWEMHNDNYELTPNMDRIFEEWVGKDHVKTLYEVISYCLIPSYPLNRLFCFIGSGMNGKSCFLNLLEKFLGKENTCSTELDILINSRFEITRLHRKLLCIMGETNFNEMSKTSIIKKLTGGDLIGFEYKNKQHFHDHNYAKIIIATNNLPVTTDKTLGFYRRWLIIDFPNRFTEEKDILTEIPDEEYEALALKCTGILHDLLKKRKFHNEGSVEDRMERYEAKSDFLQHFLDEYTVESLNDFITKAEFYKKFCEWCRENRHRELAENTLGKKMKEKGIEPGRRYVDWLHDGKGGQMKIWEGIKWKE
jgi:putative DNA primase/helicase